MVTVPPTTPATPPASPLRRGRTLWETSTKELRQAFSNVKSENTARLPIRHLSLMIIAASLLITWQNRENKKGSEANHKLWMENLLDGGVTYFLAVATKGWFPLVALMKTVYDASHDDSNLARIQTIVRDGLAMGAGYLGVYLGKGFTDFVQSSEHSEMMETLRGQALADFFSSSAIPTTAGDPLKIKAVRLKRVTKILNTKLTKWNHEVSLPHPDKVTIEKLENEIRHAESWLLRFKNSGELQDLLKLDNLPEASVKAVRKIMGLTERSNSFLIQVGRALNPIAAFLIATTLTVPLIKWVNTKLAQKFPQLAQNKGNHFDSGDFLVFGKSGSRHNHPGIPGGDSVTVNYGHSDTQFAGHEHGGNDYEQQISNEVKSGMASIPVPVGQAYSSNDQQPLVHPPVVPFSAAFDSRRANAFIS